MGGGSDSPHERILIILPGPEPTEAIERLRKRYANIQWIKYIDTQVEEDPSSSTIPDDLYGDITSLVTFSNLPSSADVAPHLSLIHFASAGTNHIAHHPIYTHSTIPLTTSSGIHGPQIAEWVIMTWLSASHNFVQLHEWQRAHVWPPGGQTGIFHNLRDKSGQRLGVLGYGSIGRQVGRVAKAMGMDVLAYTAHPRPTLESKKDHGFIVPGTGDPDGSIPSAWYSGLDRSSSLHDFLAQDLDHLLIAVPLTNETRHFISTAELAILGRRGGRHTYVTNISRGPIVDQPALIEALRTYAAHDPLQGGDGGDGGIRGASLDVTDPEPLPADSPLWDAPNVIISPHISGAGSTYVDRVMQVFEINLQRRWKGEKLINEVNRKRGY